jgi:small-conductance mechanosensitive channel
VSTKVTIGYDTPWRQVHAMLIAAAEQTPGLRSLPTPFVYQRGLADWYVEYELFAHMDKPLERVPVLSALHANIQDQFNTYGVQIMSPHFVMQPATIVVVPREHWHAPAGRRRSARDRRLISAAADRARGMTPPVSPGSADRR